MLNRYLSISILIASFLLIKLSTLGIRMSDTNPYFYTAFELLNGKLLYKDVFFTNLPLFPYISSLYLLISGKSLLFYYFTAAIESSIVGFLIYHILLKQTKNMILSTCCSTLYLFSFILLATTDHQTGVFLASVFAVLSYYFYTEKKFLFTGICIGLAMMTKAYFLPIFLTYVVMLLKDIRDVGGVKDMMRNKGRSGLPAGRGVSFLLGFTGAVFVILLPTLLFAPNDFIRDVFQYSLTRSQGLSKTAILRFFVTHDLLIFASFVYSLIMIRKYTFFGILAIFSLLFIIFYKDIYYLYLNFLFPFFCLAFANLYQDIQKRTKIQEMIIPTVIVIFIIINCIIYFSGYHTLQKIERLEELTTTINELNPPSLYGENSTTAALAYLTNTPMLNKTVDTNLNLFRKGYLNATDLTKRAIADKSLIVAQGLDYPEFGVRQDATDEVYDLNLMKNCTVIKSIPVRTEGYQNRINLIQCQ